MQNHTELLRKQGLKATPTRLAVMQVLSESTAPLSIQDVLKKVGKQKMDQVTAYRILQTLNEVGVVRKIDLHHNRSYFELAPQTDHHHIICTECGKMEDVEGCVVEDMLKSTLKQSKQFAQLTEHSFEIFGLCKECARKQKSV